MTEKPKIISNELIQDGGTLDLDTTTEERSYEAESELKASLEDIEGLANQMRSKEEDITTSQKSGIAELENKNTIPL